ncbi:ankyrin-2-like [Mizuhopecten yessoensis]|uniref:Serine/threonine-protein phosphatase 6 regulatory ankyrin repeat subunit A n=1 Tax=Mizuhopecten yessoensis TaxID=6573 RepID=A0A210QI72_MIZYE|nr:ankyrin-2-like [Mizuhopecten yessoensis]OWF48399.1 Serine/threonine-protein phosphatase 6 regulatory ankyrin repeat subunit A [Mizuhopecten yessoensis]
MADNNPFKGLFKLIKERTPEAVACRTSDLHKAATLGDIGLLQKCLEGVDVDINLRDELGNTPLYMATMKSHRAAVDILLQNGAAVNDTCCSPMHNVRDVHIAKALVEAGGRLGDRDDFGNTPLHRAVTREDIGLVFYLLQLGADTNAQNALGNTPLHSACRFSKDGPICEVITRLISAGATVNMRDKVGKTPLHHACEILPMFDSIAILIKHGAALDIHDRKGYCPIHYLIDGYLPTNTEEEAEFASKLDLLLTSPETIDVATVTGLSAIHIAASRGLCIIIKHLVQKGCDVRCQDGRGKGLLHTVASAKEAKNSVDTTQTLISCGCDVDCSDFWGSTPLHEAVANDKFDVAEVLVNNKADIEIRDNNGTSALHLAAANCSDAVTLLLDKGATVNATDKYLSTPLHFAAWANSWLATETLVSHGADREMKDLSGSVPRDTAIFKYSDVVEILGSEESSHSIKTFSDVANKLMSKNDFDDLLGKDGKLTRSDRDITQFCDSAFNTSGVGLVLFEDEARDIHTAVEGVAETIVQHLGKLDSNFKATLLRAGSSSEGTKTRYPDEFDFMFCLEEFSENTYPEFQEEDEYRTLGAGFCPNKVRKGGILGDLIGDTEPSEELVTISDYTRIYVKDTIDAEPLLDLSERDSRVIPCYMMYHQFSHLLTKVLLSESFPKNPNLLIQEVTIEPALSLQWRGSRYKMMDINVDLVPAIRLPCWPEKIRRDCKLFTPDILSIPGMAVPKMAGGECEDLWRYSMSLHETAIFRKLKPRIRNSYTTAKALLNSTLVCPLAREEETEESAFYRQSSSMASMCGSEEFVFITTAGEAIPSYFLKMMFLFSLEYKVGREGLGSVYDVDSQNRKSEYSQSEVSGTITNTEHDIDPDSSSPPSKRKRLACSYGPAEVRNVQSTERDIDIALVRDIYRRCEACLSEGKVPSFFNPRQDVLGSRGEEQSLEMALNYTRFINKLLED